MSRSVRLAALVALLAALTLTASASADSGGVKVLCPRRLDVASVGNPA